MHGQTKSLKLTAILVAVAFIGSAAQITGADDEDPPNPNPQAYCWDIEQHFCCEEWISEMTILCEFGGPWYPCVGEIYVTQSGQEMNLPVGDAVEVLAGHHWDDIGPAPTAGACVWYKPVCNPTTPTGCARAQPEQLQARMCDNDEASGEPDCVLVRDDVRASDSPRHGTG